MIARTPTTIRLILVTVTAIGVPAKLKAQEYERSPIEYSKRTPNNAVSDLQARLKQGKTSLKHEDHFGYLRAILAELKIPVSSQTLVFSKTSLQRDRISPLHPRSIYFNDDHYIGFCQFGDVLEISTADPNLGGVFYTLDQYPSSKPQIVRQTDSCLLCHGSANTEGVPGHLVRSVFPDGGGQPIFSLGTHRIDHTSSFEQRWGGWYVTGNHGGMRHLGNQIFSKSRELSEDEIAKGMNQTRLPMRLRRGDFLVPHSDIVALMVLEYQAHGHNLLTRASFLTRIALDYEKAVKRDLGEASSESWDSTKSQIRGAGEPLVRFLLGCDEAPLKAKVTGTSGFTEDFAGRGPRDKKGRSLREFDLERKLFRYPCSYLIYSSAFDALPKEVATYVWRRLDEVLSGKDTSADFAKLTREDRQAVREILLETKPQATMFWK